MKNSLSRGALWAFAGQGVASLLAVLNFAVVGRFVTPADYGSYLLAMLVLSATQWLAMNAYREPLVQTKDITESIINSVFCVSAIVGVLLLLVMVGAAAFYPRTTAACIVLLGAKLLVDTFTTVPAALKLRRLDFRLLSIIGVSTGVVGSVVNISMLFLGYGILSLAWSQLLAALAGLVFHIWSGEHRYRFALKRTDLSVIVKYSPHVIFWQAIEALNQTVDRAFIVAKLDTVSLGFYGFGKRLNDTVMELLLGTASSVSLPAFSRLQDDKQQLRDTFLKAVRIVTVGVMPVLAVLHVTAADLVPLVFGDKWAASLPIYRWFLMLGIIQTIGILQGALIKSLSRPGIWSKYTAVQSVANVIVVIFAVKYGIEVLAASIVIRTYLIWGWAVVLTCSLLEVSVLRYAKESLLPILIAACAAGAGYLCLYALGDARPLIRLVLSGGATFAAYLILSLLFMRKGMGEIKSLFLKIVLRTG